mgnify:CR=1 FL=1
MYRYEIQQRQEMTRPRGQGAEKRGGRNCGTYGVVNWKQRAVTNDRDAAVAEIAGLGADWRVFDNETDEVVVA